MTALRAVLVDDEAPARERLRRLLGEHADVEIAAEAEDGAAALAAVEASKPDVVFLDIEMPGPDGLEVAASLPVPGPRVVFCTAFDQYAVDAFELHAVDYLLKPVTRPRLRDALERVRASTAPEDERSASEAIDRARSSVAGPPRRFLAKVGRAFVVVPWDDVETFESDGGVTALRTAEHRGWMQPTLADLESRLDPEQFARISRSTIVRLGAVRRITPREGGTGTVVLASGREVEVSRRRIRALLERFAG